MIQTIIKKYAVIALVIVGVFGAVAVSHAAVSDYTGGWNLGQRYAEDGVGFSVGGLFGTGDANLPNSSVKGIVRAVMYWILGLVGIFAVISFAIAGLLYMFNVGDQAEFEKAKRAFRYGVYGVIIALSGLIILRATEAALSANPTF